MNPTVVVVSLPRWACAVLLVMLAVHFIVTTFVHQAVRDEVDDHTRRLDDHDQVLIDHADRHELIADHLQIDIYTSDVPDDWAEQVEEASEPAPHLQPGPDAASPLATQEQQMTEPVDPLPPTEPMRAVPALVDDVPLARALAEIENSMRDWRTDLDAKLRGGGVIELLEVDDAAARLAAIAEGVEV